MLSKFNPKIEKMTLNKNTPTKDDEIYLGDQSVIDRLNDILDKIKNGYYNDETKEKIFYQNQVFAIDDAEEKQNLQTDIKYYITGWFIHNFFNENFDKENHD